MILLRNSVSGIPLRTDPIPAKLFAFQGLEPVDSKRIFENRRLIGIAVYYIGSDNEVLLYMDFQDAADEAIITHAIAFVTNYAISAWHPSCIHTYTKDQRLAKALPVNLFYPKGGTFKRVVEEWRYRIPDTCFDGEGYIIHQGLMSPLPFGWRTTKETGCGWIAAYNFLKLNGKEITMEETAVSLAKQGFFGEYFGENYFLLVHWLKQKGMKVRLAIGKRAVIKGMKESRNGILLYSRRFGGHYCAYRVRKDGTFYFFNALYGRRFHSASQEQFFAQYATGFKTMLIYVV